MEIDEAPVLLNFNDSPKLSSNGNLEIHSSEKILFSSQAKSDLEDFGSQGTLIVTNRRIGWVSADTARAFECPPNLLGVYGKAGNEMFMQIMSEPALSFNFTFANDDVVVQLEVQLETCLNQQTLLNDVDNPMNETFPQIISNDSASNMPASEFNQLPLANSIEDFMSGGWITSENVNSFSQQQLNEISEKINFIVQENTSQDQEMMETSEKKEVITFPGSHSQSRSSQQIQVTSTSNMESSQYQQVPLASNISDFFKGGWITSENVSNFTEDELNKMTQRMMNPGDQK